MKKLVLFLFLCASLLNCGCAYKFSYQTGLMPSGEKITDKCHIFMWGWVPSSEPVQIDMMAPDGIAEFGSYTGVDDWFFAGLTAGFYTPQTVYVIPGVLEQPQQKEIGEVKDEK